MVKTAQRMGRRPATSILNTTKGINVSAPAIKDFVDKMKLAHFIKLSKRIQKHTISKECRVISTDAARLALSKAINREDPSYQTTPSDSYTQGLLTTLFDVNRHMPIALDLSPEIYNERKAFLSMIPYLKRGDILIFDRGYFSDDLLTQLQKKGVSWIFRMKKNSKIIQQRDGNDVRVSHLDYNIRKIAYQIGNESYFLLTNLGYRYKWRDLLDLYHSRWTIEVWFRYLKMDLGGDFYRYKKLDRVVKQLYWQMIISQLFAFVKKEVQPRIKRKGNYQIGFKYLLHHAIDLLSHFAFLTRHSEKNLERLFNIYSLTCLTPIIELRSYPRIAILDKGTWYRGKTGSEK